MTTFHGTYGLGPKGIKKIYNRVMTLGEKVIVISSHIKNHVLKHYKVDESKLIIDENKTLTSIDPILDIDKDGKARWDGIKSRHFAWPAHILGRYYTRRIFPQDSCCLRNKALFYY